MGLKLRYVEVEVVGVKSGEMQVCNATLGVSDWLSGCLMEGMRQN